MLVAIIYGVWKVAWELGSIISRGREKTEIYLRVTFAVEFIILFDNSITFPCLPYIPMIYEEHNTFIIYTY